MNFSENFENAKNFATETAQLAAKKAKELAAIAKANLTIYAEEDKIKKAQLELGKLYYRDYAVGEEMDSAEYLPWCQKIDESKKTIAELKDSIDAMKNDAAEDAIFVPDEPEAAPESPEEPEAPAAVEAPAEDTEIKIEVVDDHE